MKKLRLILSIVMLYMLLPLSMAAADNFSERAASLSEVTGVRTSSSSDKVRIVIDASKPVTIKKMVLSSPERVVVDIQNAWLSPKLKKDQGVSNRFVSSVRMAQFDQSTVRVVIETKVGKNNYNVFTLSNPSRVVMDFGNLTSSSDTKIKLPDNVQTAKPAEKEEPKDEPTKEPITAPDDENNSPIKDAADSTGSNKTDDSSDNNAEDDEWSAITGLKGRKITIDAGHGGSDSGAIGPTGIMEKSVTLRIANELKRLLVQEGATIYMTRETDTEVSPKKANASDIEELQARCDVANNSKSDIFISIHMDSFSNGAAKGTTGYYYALGSKKSRDLADKVRSGVIDQIGTQSRGTQSCNFYVVKHTDMPATLVEVAFISNDKEEKLLNSEDGIKKAAQGIADGIADYFG